MDDMKNLKSFVVPETVSRPSSLSVDEEFRTNYRCNAFFEVLVNQGKRRDALTEPAEL
jgi:hypothetical protein